MCARDAGDLLAMEFSWGEEGEYGAANDDMNGKVWGKSVTLLFFNDGHSPVDKGWGLFLLFFFVFLCFFVGRFFSCVFFLAFFKLYIHPSQP